MSPPGAESERGDRTGRAGIGALVFVARLAVDRLRGAGLVTGWRGLGFRRGVCGVLRGSLGRLRALVFRRYVSCVAVGSSVGWGVPLRGSGGCFESLSQLRRKSGCLGVDDELVAYAENAVASYLVDTRQGGRPDPEPPSDLAQGIPALDGVCLLYTSPSPRDGLLSRMPSSA